MKKTKVINLPEIGPIHLEESSRARYLNISIRPERKVRVAVPRGLSFSRAESFVRGKAEWIKDGLRKIDSHRSKVEAAAVVEPGLTKKEAKARIKERLSTLSFRHNLPYNRLSIRSQRSRWGSCSSINNISLNIKIARLPRELADYVILHELVHTRVRNHSKKFWELLEVHLKGAKALDRALKSYHPLYLKDFE